MTHSPPHAAAPYAAAPYAAAPYAAAPHAAAPHAAEATPEISVEVVHFEPVVSEQSRGDWDRYGAESWSGSWGEEINVTVRSMVRLLPVLMIGLGMVGGGIFLAWPSQGPTHLWGASDVEGYGVMGERDDVGQVEGIDMSPQTVVGMMSVVDRFPETEGEGHNAGHGVRLTDEEIDACLKAFLSQTEGGVSVAPTVAAAGVSPIDR